MLSWRLWSLISYSQFPWIQNKTTQNSNPSWIILFYGLNLIVCECNIIWKDMKLLFNIFAANRFHIEDSPIFYILVWWLKDLRGCSRGFFWSHTSWYSFYSWLEQVFVTGKEGHFWSFSPQCHIHLKHYTKQAKCSIHYRYTTHCFDTLPTSQANPDCLGFSSTIFNTLLMWHVEFSQ